MGFLYSDEVGDIKGNQAFWDQNLALRWTKDNIPAFGGDLNQVTLIGESAGARSVISHILSPESRGLFTNAIIQSSPILDRTFIATPQKHEARILSGIRKAGCAGENDKTISKKVVECLEKLDPVKADRVFHLADKDAFGM